MPRMPKLPAPPVPSALQTPPPRPHEEKAPGGPVEGGKHGGIAVVDWVDERTSLSGGVRWAMFRKVPKGTNWFYTLGSATMFAPGQRMVSSGPATSRWLLVERSRPAEHWCSNGRSGLRRHSI